MNDPIRQTVTSSIQNNRTRTDLSRNTTDKSISYVYLDLHEYTHGANLIPRPGHPHPLTHETLPLTLGHEFSGTITALGAGVSKPGLHPGAKVVVQPTIYDGVCSACVEGATNCCEKNGFVGLSGWGGGLSEVVCVPEKAVVVLPEGVSLMDGGMLFAVTITIPFHKVLSRSLVFMLGDRG